MNNKHKLVLKIFYIYLKNLFFNSIFKDCADDFEYNYYRYVNYKCVLQNLSGIKTRKY